MPRKRTHGKQRTSLTIEDVSIDEFLAMAGGFDPSAPIPPGAYRDIRWRSLEEMDADYEAIRQYSENTEWWFAGPPTFAEGRYQANLVGKGGVTCPES
jgi:hypothetical protein